LRHTAIKKKRSEAPAEGDGLAAMVRHRVPHDPVQQVDREQARIPEARFG
jgi:hypothetical protein